MTTETFRPPRGRRAAFIDAVTGLRAVVTVNVYLFAAVIVGSFPFQWVLAAARPPGADEFEASSTGKLVSAAVVQTVLALALLIGSMFATGGEGFGGRLVWGRFRVAQFIRASAVVVGVMWGVGILGLFLQRDSSTNEVATWWSTTPWFERALLAGGAGTFEEVVNIAVPVGVAHAALALTLPQMRNRDRVLWTCAIAAGGVGLVTRYTAHLYQGEQPAVAATLWGAGLLVVFAVVRTVWPVIAGHATYNFAVAGNQALPHTTGAYIVTAAAIVGAAIALPTIYIVWRRRSQRRAECLGIR